MVANDDFAHQALEHHAAGDDYLDLFFIQRFARQFAVLRMQIGRLVLRTKIVRESDALIGESRPAWRGVRR